MQLSKLARGITDPCPHAASTKEIGQLRGGGGWPDADQFKTPGSAEQQSSRADLLAKLVMSCMMKPYPNERPKMEDVACMLQTVLKP